MDVVGHYDVAIYCHVPIVIGKHLHFSFGDLACGRYHYLIIEYLAQTAFLVFGADCDEVPTAG
jgi:hypothetical protein